MEMFKLKILEGISKVKTVIYYQLTLINVGEGSEWD